MVALNETNIVVNQHTENNREHKKIRHRERFNANEQCVERTKVHKAVSMKLRGFLVKAVCIIGISDHIGFQMRLRCSKLTFTARCLSTAQLVSNWLIPFIRRMGLVNLIS